MGLLIFNLDRFIVSTIKKSDSKWKEIWQATPRIILAIIIAVVISKPLEMKLFEKEINQVLLKQKKLKQIIYITPTISEAEGTAGTKLLGKGSIYKEKREKHDATLAELQQLKTDTKTKITTKENQIAALIKQQKEQVSNT